ncbi:hypothetical protein E3E14_17030 [Streptomyces sp. ICN441]|uniref:Uncharacterized protein n=1 Tax=Streptomyces tirandamycinicus TaxID=2174846 RepID=A0A2S1SNU1_9ACTN|nr:hypothetical protein DDW44_04110 [Streptomyces tirandamycinicus]TFE48862.1 hypothetical protein E3E14_17030 [Streptomyces sp. ICN441]
MPSLTVVVSSDTDICFSPGLYGHCLPTLATGWAPDSFRTGPGFPFHARTCPPSGSSTSGRPGTGNCVTSTLWTSST